MSTTEPTSKRTLLTALTLGVLVVVLAVLTVWNGISYYNRDRDADQRAAATQAARQMAVNMMSVDHTTAQRDLDRMLSGAGDTLRDQLASQSKVFTDSVQKAKAKSTVSQVDAGVVSIDGDSAEVMVSVTAMVTNPQVPNGQQRPYRYLMDLTKTGDRWLVTKLEMVP